MLRRRVHFEISYILRMACGSQITTIRFYKTIKRPGIKNMVAEYLLYILDFVYFLITPSVSGDFVGNILLKFYHDQIVTKIIFANYK